VAFFISAHFNALKRGANGAHGEKNVTRQQIIDAMTECTKTLGHTPSHVELMKHAEVSRKAVRRHFSNYGALLAECGLAGIGSGYKAPLEAVFRDWATVARTLKKIPTIADYEIGGQYSVRPLVTRFGTWNMVPYGLKLYAEEQGLAEEWKDVLAIIDTREQQAKALKALQRAPGPDNVRRARRFAAREGLDDLKRAIRSLETMGPDDSKEGKERRAIYGPVMRPYPLICGPVNEMGVVFLFGARAEELGFLVLRIQTEFPDCEALRMIDDERCERVKIEFEHESRNFLKHMHKASECDLIVCWKHNWPECPIEVLELRSALSIQQTAVSQSLFAADLRR
jgi:hypothetical protein